MPEQDSWVFFVTLILLFFGLWQLVHWLPALLLALPAAVLVSSLADIVIHLRAILRKLSEKT